MSALQQLEQQETLAPLVEKLDSVRLALAEVERLDSATEWYRRTKALEDVAKAANVSHEIKVEACELRIRWERRLGEVMKNAPKNRGAGLAGGPGRGNKTRVDRRPAFYEDDPTPTLKELGINKSLADKVRKLADIEEEAFEELIQERRDQATKNVTRSVERSLSTASILREMREKERGGREPKFSPVIKPSDNWNFSTVVFDRLDENEHSHGYIPGDLYANCLWYYTEDGDRVVAPMAGSGQIIRVWEEKEKWMIGKEWDIELLCFDLSPRGRYQDRIVQNNLVEGLPCEDVDYIVMDIPYYGMVDGQYSQKEEDVANMNLQEWLQSMSAIAVNCFSAQLVGGLCTVITPNYRDISSQQIIPVSHLITGLFIGAGYEVYDKAYSSRRIQQSQTPGMARLNNMAKDNQVMLTDMAEVLTFQKVN